MPRCAGLSEEDVLPALKSSQSQSKEAVRKETQAPESPGNPGNFLEEEAVRVNRKQAGRGQPVSVGSLGHVRGGPVGSRDVLVEVMATGKVVRMTSPCVCRRSVSLAWGRRTRGREGWLGRGGRFGAGVVTLAKDELGRICTSLTD